MNFCSRCGAPVHYRVPQGDDRSRYCCDTCGTIHYENPKVVVGSIPQWQDRILLCRRAIEPRYGMWTLPAGYLENGETVSQAAEREALEEAGARIEIVSPYALFNLAFINQVYLMFRARLTTGDCQPGSESLETRLFRSEEIPWDAIAFTVIAETLSRFCKDRAEGAFPFQIGDIAPSKEGWAGEGARDTERI